MTRRDSLELAGGYITFLDLEDIDRFSHVKWHVLHAKMGKGKLYVRGTINNKKVLLHRVIMNAPIGMHVDHIDGDTFNNRKSNLRLCACYENIRNQKVRTSNTSGFKGVFRVVKSGRWKATIRANGRPLVLGTFGSASEAALAYNFAARHYHGEYARLNEGVHV